MREHTVRTFDVEAPAKRVWQLVADLPALTALTDPRTSVTMDGGPRPVKVGTKYHLTTKSGLKSDWTVLTLVPTEVISYRIDLGVWDGGISTTELEVLAGRTRVTLKTPCVRWIGAWSIVQRATWPLVLMEAKKTCDRFEDAVRTWLATEGEAAGSPPHG